MRRTNRNMDAFIIGSAIACFVAACWLLSGCTLSKEAMTQVVQTAREIAKEQGVSWHVSFRSTGDLSVYQKISLGIDIGMPIEIRFQGNAQGGAK